MRVGIGRKLAHRLDISGEPGEPVRGALLAIKQTADHMAFHHHPLAHFGRRIRQQRIECSTRLTGKFHQIMFRNRAGGGDWHWTPRAVVPAAPMTLRVQCTKAK